MADRMTPEQRYEDLVDDLAGEEGVLPPPGGSGFGRSALRYRQKIFAMLVRGQLVGQAAPAARRRAGGGRSRPAVRRQ